MEKDIESAKRLLNYILDNFKNKTEFCNKVGISLQTLNNYTTGSVGIGNKLLKKLSGLGADVDWILTGKVSIAPPPIVVKIDDK